MEYIKCNVCGKFFAVDSQGSVTRCCGKYVCEHCGPIITCPVCGYIDEGEIPERRREQRESRRDAEYTAIPAASPSAVA